MLHAIIVWRA